MKKVIVEVEFSGNNYSCYLPDLPGCISAGITLKEVKANILEAMDFHLESMREDGDPIPEIFNGKYEVEYRLSTSALINHYSSIFTKAALSRITGINERQLWHYAAGVRKPRPAQRKRIEEGLHNLGKELMSLSLD
jgi:Uncharacterized conserved protein